MSAAVLRAPPRLLAITPPTGAVDPRRLDDWLAAGAPIDALAVLLRTPGVERPDPVDPRWRDLRSACLGRGIRVLLSCTADAWLAQPGPTGAPAIEVDGVQLKGDPTVQQLAAVRERLADDALLGRSCHGAPQAGAARVDFTCVGPVFAPRTSTPERVKQPIGLAGLSAWTAADPSSARSAPILALGGVDGARARACVAAGAYGLAGIEAFFGEASRVRGEVAAMVAALATAGEPPRG